MNNYRTVYLRSDGRWGNRKNGNTRDSSVHVTQRDADAAAATMLSNSGGGERTTQGRNHLFRSKDTIAPGNDPCPPRDREH